MASRHESYSDAAHSNSSGRRRSLNKVFSAGLLTAVSALLLVVAELTLLRQVNSEPVQPVVVGLHAGTIVVSSYLPRIGDDQRYEITFSNNRGTVIIERGDSGTRCQGSRQTISLLTKDSGTFQLHDDGGQTEICAVVSGGSPTMVISAKPFIER
jgi:hypothetical protein